MCLQLREREPEVVRDQLSHPAGKWGIRILIINIANISTCWAGTKSWTQTLPVDCVPVCALIMLSGRQRPKVRRSQHHLSVRCPLASGPHLPPGTLVPCLSVWLTVFPYQPQWMRFLPYLLLIFLLAHCHLSTPSHPHPLVFTSSSI